MFEAIVHVVDPKSFIREAYDKRSSGFGVHTRIEVTHLDGPRTVSAPGAYVSIRSDDRLNVEDVLLVDLDMDQAEADGFIKTR
jgi:hypothetical protein